MKIALSTKREKKENDNYNHSFNELFFDRCIEGQLVPSEGVVLLVNKFLKD